MQLSDISGPIVAHENGFCVTVKALERFFFFAHIFPQKVFGNAHNIFTPLAQGRHIDRQDVQAVIEIFAESSGLNLGEGVAICGTDNADIDRNFLVATDLCKAAALHKTQQFCLQVEIHFPNFIEKERPPVGLCGGTLAVCVGPCKGTFDVSENFRFHQVAGNGPAIQRAKGPILTRAFLVNGFGADFLSRSALARDENGGGTGGRRVNNPVNFLHRQGGSDKTAVVTAINF